MLMFEAFESLYVLLRDRVSPIDAEYEKIMSAAEDILRKHGKDSKTLHVRTGADFVQDLLDSFDKDKNEA